MRWHRVAKLYLGMSMALAMPWVCVGQKDAQQSGGDSTAVTPEAEIHPPVVIEQGMAVFPEEAGRLKVQGSCEVKLVVDAQGMPQDARIEHCSEPVFAENSLAAVKKYRFKPAQKAGEPVPVIITILVNFKLKGGGRQKVEFSFAPPDDFKPGPDADGAYPFSTQLEPPDVTKLPSQNFAKSGGNLGVGSACRLEMTLDAQGKPANPNILHCDVKEMEPAAVEIVKKAKYRPARLHGKAVPVRLVVQVTYYGE